MLVQDVLTLLQASECRGDLTSIARQRVAALRQDSRQVQAADVFFALRGLQVDGHRYLQEAESHGALLAVVEALDPHLALPQLLVPNCREAMALVAAEFYGRPSEELNLCGISGSIGSSTCSHLYRSILREVGVYSGLLGSLSYETGKFEGVAELVTPDAIDLQAYLRQMVESGIRYAVLEVSAVAQDRARTAHCHFDQVALLNLSDTYPDFYADREQYWAAMEGLVRAADADCGAVLNYDYPVLRQLADEVAAQCFFISLRSPEAHLYFEELQATANGVRAKLTLSRPFAIRGRQIPAGSIRLELGVSAEAALEAVLGAVALGLVAGFPLAIMGEALEKFDWPLFRRVVLDQRAAAGRSAFHLREAW